MLPTNAIVTFKEGSVVFTETRAGTLERLRGHVSAHGAALPAVEDGRIVVSPKVLSAAAKAVYRWADAAVREGVDWRSVAEINGYGQRLGAYASRCRQGEDPTDGKKEAGFWVLV